MSALQKIKVSGTGSKPRYRYRMQPLLPDGRRPTISLGSVDAKTARTIESHIQHLIDASKYNTRIDPVTLDWLRSADQKLAKRLHEYGLAPPIVNPTVAKFTQDYIESKKLRSAPRTIVALSQARTNLINFVGQTRLMASVTPNDAMEFFDFLQTTEGLGENTARARFSKVRQMFNGAFEREIISRNPFKLSTHSAQVGAAKKSYIPESTVLKVMDECPSVEWKLLFAFGRFVGCRIPSEIQDLTWSDVNWANNTILLKSPKTKSKGKPERLVPIFPEVEGPLREAFEYAAEGATHVFPIIRHHSNAATTAKKYVNNAGFAAWDKFWNALRASRETDLMDQVGLRRACAWIGNSPKVAMANYALMRSTDYIDAGKKPEPKSYAPEAQCLRELGGIDGHISHVFPVNQRIAEILVAETGLEPARE